MKTQHYDVVIIGSGPGGGSVALGLAATGAKILVIERGDFLPMESQNWSSMAVFSEHRYKCGESWWDERQSRPFRAGAHYWVGGNTKMYGAALTRPRRGDFAQSQFPDGTSPAWPISYDDLSPFYSRAEGLLRVHGALHEDPAEPEHDSPYPFPAVPHEPYVEKLARGLAAQGLRPVHLPMGIDLRPGGACAYCGTCDGFPCLVRAKSDAETCLVRPALGHSQVQLLTRTLVTRLNTSPDGRAVTSILCTQDGREMEISAGTFVVSAGAVNSAALLLRSANSHHPRGLANSSDMVGRNYMMHNNAVVAGVDPRQPNTTMFQKTLVINDWYFPGDASRVNFGSAQLIGKMQGSMLKGTKPLLPKIAADWIAGHSHEWWLLTEDLPDLANRVTLREDGSISIYYQPNNRATLYRLAGNLKRALRKAGFPIVLTHYPGMEVTSHQAGTVRFGHDPASSVLNQWCQSHDVSNLYVVDSSFFPSHPAMGPVLTIVAQGLRVAAHIAARGGGA